MGLAKGGQPYPGYWCQRGTDRTRPILADAGIDKKLSSRAHKLAAVSEEQHSFAIAAQMRNGVREDFS